LRKSKKLLLEYTIGNLAKTFFALGKSEIRNCVNLPDGPCIMAFNHVSYWDWIIVFGMFDQKMNKKITFIGKKRLFEHWFFKHLMDYGNVICVDQEKVGKEFLTSVKRTLQAGNILGIFPEGTRSEDGKLMKAQPGMTRLALMNKVPVVPVGLNGFYDILPKGKKIPRIKKLSINIGAPVYLDEYYGKKLGEKDIENITRTIMTRIGELINQKYDY
jgi:1-acyl-sn-glycerol-3-phosphate acyltransferase